MNEIGFEEFGRRLVEEILTADRVRETLEATLAGEFDTAVKMAGGIVRAEGAGSVWRVEADRIEHAGDDRVAYRAYLHVDMDLTVRVSGVPYRYKGKAMIELDLRAIIRDDMSIFIDVPTVTDGDVSLELTPLGRMATVIDQIGGVSDQVQREIVKFANRQKDLNTTIAARTIDLGETIEAEWERRRSTG